MKAKRKGDRGLGVKNNRIIDGTHERKCPVCELWKVAEKRNYRMRPDGNFRAQCRQCERDWQANNYHEKRALIADGAAAVERSREVVCSGVHDLAAAMRQWV